MSAPSPAGDPAARGSLARVLWRSSVAVSVAAVVIGFATVVAALGAPPPAAAATASHDVGTPAVPGLVGDPAGLVDPLDGTGAGPVERFPVVARAVPITTVLPKRLRPQAAGRPHR